jgi:TRAP-type C4-dicarboxylate transport system substrate-binding protein
LAAQTKLDISMPWGPTEFHTVNAQNFAKRVAEVTKGQVLMTVHPGGALGIKANETVRAIEDGAATMAEFAGFQNVGDLPLLGLESIPFLVDDYEQLKVMHSFVRPKWVEDLAKRAALGAEVLMLMRYKDSPEPDLSELWTDIYA